MRTPRGRARRACEATFSLDPELVGVCSGETSEQPERNCLDKLGGATEQQRQGQQAQQVAGAADSAEREE